MPTYQYKCKACEHRFDIVQKITAEALTVCPECSGEIRRVMFPAGVVFKGSGWYVTDYRNSTEKAKYAADSTGDSATPVKSDGAKSDGKPSDTKVSETTPDAKTESKTVESKPAESKSESKPADTAKAAA